jgi:hypothetical protein
MACYQISLEYKKILYNIRRFLNSEKEPCLRVVPCKRESSRKTQNAGFPVKIAESAKGGCEISIIVQDRD